MKLKSVVLKENDEWPLSGKKNAAGDPTLVTPIHITQYEDRTSIQIWYLEDDNDAAS